MSVRVKWWIFLCVSAINSWTWLNFGSTLFWKLLVFSSFISRILLLVLYCIFCEFLFIYSFIPVINLEIHSVQNPFLLVLWLLFHVLHHPLLLGCHNILQYQLVVPFLLLTDFILLLSIVLLVNLSLLQSVLPFLRRLDIKFLHIIIKL